MQSSGFAAVRQWPTLSCTHWICKFDLNSEFIRLEMVMPPPPPPARDAFEGKTPQRRPQRRLGRRLEEVAEAVRGGYCRLQMPWKPALAVRETVAGYRLGALERGGGGAPPPPV